MHVPDHAGRAWPRSRWPGACGRAAVACSRRRIPGRPILRLKNVCGGGSGAYAVAARARGVARVRAYAHM
eukprot:1331337-Pyramimonas_sp.AAC.1